jgi:hypothetical protein
MSIATFMVAIAFAHATTDSKSVSSRTTGVVLLHARAGFLAFVDRPRRCDHMRPTQGKHPHGFVADAGIASGDDGGHSGQIQSRGDFLRGRLTSKRAVRCGGQRPRRACNESKWDTLDEYSAIHGSHGSMGESKDAMRLIG